MSPIFSLKTGLVTGRDHILSGKNCQDALRYKSFSYNNLQYSIGFICDGCSSGRFSEVGANLGAEFLLYQIEVNIRNGLAQHEAVLALYSDLLNYLWWILNAYQTGPNEQSIYIQDYFLFTVLGVVVGPEETEIISAGDGVYCVNDDITTIDFDNMPPYPAYHLVDQTFLSPDRSLLPDSFRSMVYRTADISKLAIGSDAWGPYTDLINELWGSFHPNSVQRKMNVWSINNHYLQDDASIIVIEKSDQEA